MCSGDAARGAANPMTRRMVVALGAGQCVNWGVLYYAFAVLVRPLEREFGAPTWTVTGAFSLALLTSAALAPTVGRWADRDRGPRLIMGGGLAAAALLAAWALVPTLVTTYLAWGALGPCMAATLYEPAFVIVGRAHDDPSQRLRALAIVTLLGGLASTVFLPITAWLVEAIGWRGAVVVLATALAASAGWTQVLVFRRLAVVAAGRPAAVIEPGPHDRRAEARGFAFVAATFGAVSLAGAAFVANLVPAMGERGVGPATAALLGGLIGVMQLPGRALMMHGALGGPPGRLLAISLGLQGLGFGAVASGRSVLVIAAGITVFALGAGLSTLVRPHLVQSLFATRNVGWLNGRIARQQQLARAAGPMAAAWLAGRVGYTAVLTGIAATFVLLALASRPAMRRLQAGGRPGQS